MSEDLDRVVSVTITRETTTPTMEAFNGILIAAEFLKSAAKTPFATTERVREYGSLKEVGEDFSTTTFMYKAAQAVFAQNPAVDSLFIGRKETGDDGSEDWPTALSAMVEASGAWYGLVVSTRTLADQKLIADWVEANTKLCAMSSADANIIGAAYSATPVDIADYIKSKTYDRTFVFYHPDAGGENDCFIDAAMLGKEFPYDPGSQTWAFKTLKGVTCYQLTTAQISHITSKSANFYTSIADVKCTQFGTSGSGEYIDVIHGLDWLKARIQNRIFTPMVQQGKIPFTNAGIQIIATQLKAALKEAVINKILDSNYNVTYPDVVTIAPDKKATRTLPDVNFTATLAGAIHKVVVEGVVTV